MASPVPTVSAPGGTAKQTSEGGHPMYASAEKRFSVMATSYKLVWHKCVVERYRRSLALCPRGAI